MDVNIYMLSVIVYTYYSVRIRDDGLGDKEKMKTKNRVFYDFCLSTKSYPTISLCVCAQDTITLYIYATYILMYTLCAFLTCMTLFTLPL